MAQGSIISRLPIPASRLAAVSAQSTTSTPVARSTRSRQPAHPIRGADKIRAFACMHYGRRPFADRIRHPALLHLQRLEHSRCAGAGLNGLYVTARVHPVAGFTAGLAQSFFDFYSTPAYSNTTNVWGLIPAVTVSRCWAILPVRQWPVRHDRSGRSSHPPHRDQQQRLRCGGPGIPGRRRQPAHRSAVGQRPDHGCLARVKSQYYTTNAPVNGHPGDKYGWAVGARLEG